MDRRVALTVVAGGLVTLVLVAVATSGSVPLAQRRPSMPFDLPEFDLAQPTITTLAPEPEGTPGARTSTRSSDVVGYLQDVLMLGVLALIGLGVVRAWQHRPRLLWRPKKSTDDFVRLEEVAAALTADARAQRAALEHGEARNAIVACWARLERLVATAGFERDPADTAAEFTARILSRYPVNPNTIDGLSALYREARFSTHVMGEPERDAAIAALDALHEALRAAADVAVPT